MTRATYRIRSAGLVALLAVLAGGCGTDPHVDAADQPMTTPTSTAPPGSGGIPDDFPLAEGLVADGDTTVSATRRDIPGVRLARTCWGSAWPGAAVDRLVVEQEGPELGVTRELAVYPDAATAAAVGEQVRRDATRCRRLPAASPGAAMDVTMLGDVHTGDSPVVALFAETLGGGQPGGAVLVFTRVGRAVLAVEDSGEWTRESAADGARDLVRANRVVVAHLCELSGAGC